MSPSRGSKGESEWSGCSVQSLRKADLHCLDENSNGVEEHLAINAGVYPGEVWDANRQCQIFLLDQNAHMDHTDQNFRDMCYSLKCRTPTREGEGRILLPYPVIMTFGQPSLNALAAQIRLFAKTK